MVGFLAVVAVAAIVLVCARTDARRPHALGLVAGVLCGAGDAATKAATTLADGRLVSGLLSPWVSVVLVGSLGAFFCFQRALQLGSVLAVMTAAIN